MFSFLPPTTKAALQELFKEFCLQADATRAKPLWIEFERNYPFPAGMIKAYVARNNSEVIRNFLLSLPLSDEVKEALKDEGKATAFINSLKEEIK